MTVGVGDWVERRYGYGENRWSRVTGHGPEGHDYWVVAAVNGCIHRDNGRDLAIATRPAPVSDDFAVEPGIWIAQR